MGATLTLGKLIGPIATATIVTAFWFAVMWRGHQMERGGGKLPRRYELAFFAYLAVIGLNLYALRSAKITTGLELFGAALVGEGMGIVVTFAVVQTFILSRGQPWRDRAFPVVATLFLVFLVGGAVFAS